MQDIIYIVVITNAILVTKYIFNIFLYLYQLHSIIILTDLKKFFNKNSGNMISFWDCSSNNKWPSYLLVDKKSKFHRMSLILLSKTLWEFNKKEECDFIVEKWQIYFQASNYKEKNFLNLNINDSYPIHPIYLKSRTWLKKFGLSNSLYIYITKLITNQAPIGKYKQRFFPNISIIYSCGNSLIEMKIHNCKQYFAFKKTLYKVCYLLYKILFLVYYHVSYISFSLFSFFFVFI